MKRLVSAVALALLLANVVPSFFSVKTRFDGASGVNSQSAEDQIRPAAFENMTLAQVLQSLENSVDWESSIYAGMVFGKKNRTDMEMMIDSLVSGENWASILFWTVACGKLGVECEYAIKAALDGLLMIGPLPRTDNVSGNGLFHVADKWALLGYYYAEKYSYRLDKWNKANGYNFFANATDGAGHPVLFIDQNGVTTTISYGPRYYDEAANTVQCFLVFYELGIQSALHDALYWWNWINDNLWWEGTHYKYGFNWPNYECEAGFFAEIIANLNYHEKSLANWTRVSADLQNRFLVDRWSSKQWLDSLGDSTYVVVHHYPNNQERRLQNTIGAWIALLGFFDEFDVSSRIALHDLLKGYGGLDPAWRLLMSPEASLYESCSNLFRWVDRDSGSSDATAWAMTLMLLLGIAPKTATLAFPLEEYSYEYIYGIDPELYRIGFVSSTLRVSIVEPGELEFIYGDYPTSCSLSEKGVYEIAFSNDWNNITSVSKLGDLPSNRKYMQLKHEVTADNIALNRIMVANETETTGTTVTNRGNFTETFSVSLNCRYQTDKTFESRTITLTPGESRTLEFVWTPRMLGRYEMTVQVEAVQFEASLENNARTVSQNVITLYLATLQYYLLVLADSDRPNTSPCGLSLPL